jgi:hypothetical protein
MYAAALASSLMTVHFALIHADIAFIIACTVSLTSLTSALRGEVWSLPARIGIALTAIALVLLAAPPHSWLEALPLMAFIVARFAETLRRDIPLRVLMFIPSLLWVSYDLALPSYPALANELTAIASNIVGLWRRLRHKG